MLREPVARAWSNYRWSKMNGFEAEDFATALRLEATRARTLPEELQDVRPYAYYARGLYASMLESYLSRVPRSRLLVLRFEELLDAPRAIAQRVHGFLGLEARPDDADGLAVINPSRPDEAGMPDDVARDLAARYREPNERLARLLGPDFAVWR